MKVFQVFKDEEDPTNKGSHDAHEGETGACLSSSEPPCRHTLANKQEYPGILY